MREIKIPPKKVLRAAQAKKLFELFADVLFSACLTLTFPAACCSDLLLDIKSTPQDNFYQSYTPKFHIQL